MKFTKILLAGLSLLAVAGCKTVDIKDGRVPDAYLAKAKALEGVYSGHFNGVPGELVITFEGNKPVIKYRNNGGSDILNNNCASSFGNLEQVYLNGKKTDPQVTGVNFAFNPGRCGLFVQGRDMSISFKQKDGGTKLNLTLLKQIQQQQVCTWTPGNPPHYPPQQQCTWQSQPIYIYGTFSR